MSTATLERPANAAPKQKRMYRILAGRHSETVEVGRKKVKELTPNGMIEYSEPILEHRLYGAPLPDGTIVGEGDVFESAEDVLRLNKTGMPPKFANADDPSAIRCGPNSRVFDPNVETLDNFVARIRAEQGISTEQTPAPAAPANTASQAEKLNSMTVQQLKDMAEAEEIDVSKCGNDKVKLIAAMLARK